MTTEVTNCSMQAKPGSFVVDDTKRELLLGKRSLDACKQVCLDDKECKAMYHLKEFCFIVKEDATPEPYTSDTSLFFEKDCLYKYLYSGNQCETDLEDQCKTDTCSSHGMCQDRAGDDKPICLCPIVGEYSQPKCDLVLNLCNPDPCQNGGECRSWGAVRRQCVCKPGFSGVNCSVNIDDCSLNMDGCLYNSTCRDGVDSYTCGCKSGFSGGHCQVTRDFCSGTPCPNGGCVNDYTTLSPKCFCDYPYQLGNDGQCEKMDLCNNTVCNNGTCNHLTGKCSCNSGYEGSNCQHSVDDCKDMPCKNGSTCIDGYQDYSCVCVSGFTGRCQLK
ncbi:delta-like protein B [Saccostrea echinata]|uniref:delta-like protein B n=1 Tax=Saccostrea echinata TaxID=191078 RepID=UPI002A81A87B|nr:delta-like protein B [Saccostrea echinata]